MPARYIHRCTERGKVLLAIGIANKSADIVEAFYSSRHVEFFDNSIVTPDKAAHIGAFRLDTYRSGTCRYGAAVLARNATHVGAFRRNVHQGITCRHGAAVVAHNAAHRGVRRNAYRGGACRYSTAVHRHDTGRMAATQIKFGLHLHIFDLSGIFERDSGTAVYCALDSQVAPDTPYNAAIFIDESRQHDVIVFFLILRINHSRKRRVFDSTVVGFYKTHAYIGRFDRPVNGHILNSPIIQHCEACSVLPMYFKVD